MTSATRCTARPPEVGTIGEDVATRSLGDVEDCTTCVQPNVSR